MIATHRARVAHQITVTLMGLQSAMTRNAAREGLIALRTDMDQLADMLGIEWRLDMDAMTAPSPGPAAMHVALGEALIAITRVQTIILNGGPGLPGAGSATYPECCRLLHTVRRTFWAVGETLEITGVGHDSPRSQLNQEIMAGKRAYAKGLPLDQVPAPQQGGWLQAQRESRETHLYAPAEAEAITQAGQEAISKMVESSPHIAAAAGLPVNDSYRAKGAKGFRDGLKRLELLGTLYASQMEAWTDGWEAERRRCWDAGHVGYETQADMPQDYTKAMADAWREGWTHAHDNADEAVAALNTAAGVRASGAAFNAYGQHVGEDSVREGDAKAMDDGMRAAANQIAREKLEAPLRTDSLLAYRWGYWFMLGMIDDAQPKHAGHDMCAFNAGKVYASKVKRA